MRRLLALTLLLGTLAAATVAHADGAYYPYPPQAIYPAYPAYPAYPVYPFAAPLTYGYGYAVPPPAFYFGSGYDPDYRAMRYNRYFTRNQDDPPKVRGYTFDR